MKRNRIHTADAGHNEANSADRLSAAGAESRGTAEKPRRAKNPAASILTLNQPTLKIGRPHLEQILAHARAAYPHECCGLLAGMREERRVTSVHPAANANRERAWDRYEITPQEFHRVDRTTWDTPTEIIGFYHSHPDHPAQPSAFDAERAWAGYSYAIVSIHADGTTRVRSWRWQEEPTGFVEEQVATAD